MREGARIAQLCSAEVFLLAVVEVSAGTGTLDGGFVLPITEQIEDYKKILAEGVERLKAMGFSPTARLGIGEAGREIAKVAKDIGANLVVVGHRPDGPLARWWFSSVGTYLVKNLLCSVLIAQTEIGDEEFAQLLTGGPWRHSYWAPTGWSWRTVRSYSVESCVNSDCFYKGAPFVEELRKLAVGELAHRLKNKPPYSQSSALNFGMIRKPEMRS